MRCFIEGIDLKDAITDTLCLARLYFAQGMLYEKQYLFAPYIEVCMIAYDIYNKKGKLDHALDCLALAMTGSMLSGQIHIADSINKLTKPLLLELDHSNQHMLHSQIIYTLERTDKLQSKKLLDSISTLNISNEIILDLAHGYNIIGFPYEALNFLNQSVITPNNKIKYLTIKSNILDSIKNYKDLAHTLRETIDTRDSIVNTDFSLEIQSVEKRYILEQKILNEKRSKEHILFLSICGTLLFLVILSCLLLLYRNIKIKNLKIKEQNLRLELTSMKLLQEKDKAEKEVILHKQKQGKLQQQLTFFETERNNIEANLNIEKEIVSLLRGIMKDRMSIFNGHLASIITSNEKYSIQYHELEKAAHKDQRKFLNEIKVTLIGMNPDFMKKLELLGLTQIEMDFVCLYALGLRGKEIGTYLNTKRQYIISSEIRAKLGLRNNDTNIGVFIQSQFK